MSCLTFLSGKLTMMKLSILLLAAFFSALRVQAQGVQKWEHYSNSNTPECLIQDGQFLWVGTDGGLIKFDKNVDTFAIFNPQNSGLTITSVLSLTRGSDGSIWVGTRGGGLASLVNGVWSTYTTSNSRLPSDWVAALAADSAGRMWIGTNGGLAKIDKGIWTIYTTANTQFLSSAIYALATDPQSNVWISTNSYPQVAGKSSLLKFDGNATWELHDATTDIGFDDRTNVSTMLVAKNGDLWIGMEGYLDHIHNNVWDSRDAVPEYNGSLSNHVRGLAEDASGGIWISDAYGAARFDGTKWTDTFKIESQTFPYLRSNGVVFDRGDLWFISSNMDAQDGNGIARFRQGKWMRFDSLSNCPLDANWLTSMTIDSKGRYWFGERLQSKVSMFDGHTWTHFDDLTQGAYSMSMCADSAGNVYIGTGYSSSGNSWNGLIKFDGVTPQYFDLNKLINHSNVVSALAYDKRGVLWIGTQWQGNSGLQSGLVRYDGTTWSEYPYSPTTLPEGEVSSLAVDTLGGVWAATWYGGIAHFDGINKWSVYHPSNSLIPSDQVFKVDQAQNGDIWIATLSGAAKWNGATWAPFTTGNSGIIDNLATCGIDSKGNVWFGAFNGTGGVGGACQFDGTNWTMFTPVNSSIGSNLLENIMGGINGDVWFETYDIGIVRYNPQGFQSPCLNQVAHLSIIENPQIAGLAAPTNGVIRSVVTLKDSVPQSLGLSVVSLTVKYDERMLTRKNVSALNGWKIDQMKDGAAGLDLVLSSSPHNVRTGEAIVAIDLQVFVGVVSTSAVQLLDTRFNPADPKFENCTLASIAQDSLIISLGNACGDSVIRASLDHTPLLQLLGANPDPVVSSNASITLTLNAARGTTATVNITSLSGATISTQTIALVQGKSSYPINLSGFASGGYVIEVTAGASRVSRKFAVE